MVKGLIGGQEVRAASSGRLLERALVQAVRLVAALLALLAIGLAAIYLSQRYAHETVSVVDRDIELVEGQIRQRPGDPELRVAVANLYVEKGRYDDAIAQAVQVLQVRPGHLAATLALALAYARKDESQQSVPYLARAVELSQDAPMARSSLQLALVHQLLADTYLRQGRTAQALDELRQALEIDPTNADSLFLLGKGQAAQGQLDDAIHSYRQALRFVPDFPEVYAELARVYELKGDSDLGLFARGMVRYTAAEYVEAVETLQRATRALPDLAEAHLGLAMAYEKQGQWSQALDEYRRSAALDGSSIAARQGAARLGGQP